MSHKAYEKKHTLDARMLNRYHFLAMFGLFPFFVVTGYLLAACSHRGLPSLVQTHAPATSKTPVPLIDSGSVMTSNVAAPVGFTIAPAPVPQVVPGDWSSFLLGNNGFNSSETSINVTTAAALQLYWAYHAEGSITAQPVVVNGTIYWGSWDGFEHATNLNGEQVWATNLGITTDTTDGCYPTSAGVASTATVAPLTIGGITTLVVFVGGGDADFYALNAFNGHVIWKTSLGSSPAYFIWSSPVVYNGSIYIGVSSFGDCPAIQGQFVQMSMVDGSIQNVFNVVPDGCVGGSVWGSPTLDPSTGELYIATGNASTCSTTENYAVSVIELHASDLAVAGSWQVPPSQWAIDSDFGSTPTLFTATIGGATLPMVGAINKNGIYYAFTRGAISNGPVWTAQISNAVGSIASSAWDGTRLYVAGGNTTINGKFCEGSLRALDLGTGNFIWERCLQDSRVLAAVTVVPGLVVVEQGRFVLRVEATTGKILFEYEDSSKDSIFWAPATISHGMLYVGNMDGNLYAFGPYRTSPRHLR